MLKSLTGFFGRSGAIKQPKKKPKGRRRNVRGQSRPPFILPKVAVPSKVDGIEIDYADFPKIRLESRPKHSEYEAVRHGLMQQALLAVNPFYQFLIQRKGIVDSRDMQATIRDIIYTHISVFWDIPSSENHHHNVPWGGLVHSLETACREAVHWQQGKIFTSAGVDSERSLKDPLWQGFAGFLVGIMHDVGKIHFMRITSNSTPPAVFQPFRGHLLDFLLVHPEGINIKWLPSNESLNPNYNMMRAWTHVSTDVYRQMPHDLLMAAMEKLLSYEKLASDRASVQKWAQGGDFHSMLVRTIGEWFLQSQDDFGQGPSALFHKLDQHWVACDNSGFVGVLAKRLGHNREDLQKALVQAELMPKGQSSGRFYEKLTLTVQGQEVCRDTCFLRIEPFRSAFERVARSKGKAFELPNRAAQLSLAEKPLVARIFEGASPELAAYVFGGARAVEKDTAQKSPAPKKAALKGAFKEKSQNGEQAVQPVTMDDLYKAFPVVGNTKVNEQEQGEAGVDVFENGSGGDEKAALSQEKIEKHLVQASLSENREGKTVPFYEVAGSAITLEQSQERFVELLDSFARKKKYFQKTKGSYLWLTTDDELYLRYPGGINSALDLPKKGRLTEKAVVLRSKFLAHLQTLGYVLSVDKEEDGRRRINFYVAQDGQQTEIESVKTSVVHLDHEKVFDLSPEFARRLKILFSINRSVQAGVTEQGEEGEDE